MGKSKINLSKINQCHGILSLLVLLAAYSRTIPYSPVYMPGTLATFGVRYFSIKYFPLIIAVLLLCFKVFFINTIICTQFKTLLVPLNPHTV